MGIKSVCVFALFGAAVALASACSSSSGSGGSGGGAGTGAKNTLPSDTGICQGSCPKDCSSDNDCETSKGELCCDIGVGKICLDGAECPRFCTDDSQCATSKGEACLRVSLANPQKICTKPSAAIQLCSSDTQCSDGDVCCGNYNEPVCMPASQCPKSCAASADCDTGSGEICCTSVQKVDSTLSASGLCLNPDYSPCPTACTQSSDCIGNAAGALCCDGVCQETCEKQCKSSNDCSDPDARLCCKSAIVRLPQESGVVFTTGPTCVGTPFYTSCSSCSGGSCCSSIPGCTSGAAPGTCVEEFSDFCDEHFDSATCAAAGCIWDSTDLLCSGTPTNPCPKLTTSATCAANTSCVWQLSGISTCTGTPTYKSCTGLPPAMCGTVLGCTLSQNPLPGSL